MVTEIFHFVSNTEKRIFIVPSIKRVCCWLCWVRYSTLKWKWHQLIDCLFGNKWMCVCVWYAHVCIMYVYCISLRHTDIRRFYFYFHFILFLCSIQIFRLSLSTARVIYSDVMYGCLSVCMCVYFMRTREWSRASVCMFVCFAHSFCAAPRNPIRYHKAIRLDKIIYASVLGNRQRVFHVKLTCVTSNKIEIWAER